VLTNAVITWMTEYHQLAVQHLRATGRDVPENVNFFRVITVDVEAELA
jgi:hypothetical protein